MTKAYNIVIYDSQFNQQSDIIWTKTKQTQLLSERSIAAD